MFISIPTRNCLLSPRSWKYKLKTEIHLQKLNADSSCQCNNIVNRIVGELLASFSGPHQNTPAISNDLRPYDKQKTKTKNEVKI